MSIIRAEGALRNKYIAPYPIYPRCADCKMWYTHGPSHVLAGKPALSRYPYCMNCLRKNAGDPYFVAWLKKLFKLNKLQTS